MIVLDASAAVELILQTAIGSKLTERLERERPSLHAPDVLELEVVQVLRKLLAAGGLGEARAQLAFDDFRAMRLVRHAAGELLPRIWALRANLTAYDAAYIALAESLDAPLVTCDGKLKRAPGHRVTVQVLA